MLQVLALLWLVAVLALSVLLLAVVAGQRLRAVRRTRRDRGRCPQPRFRR